MSGTPTGGQPRDVSAEVEELIARERIREVLFANARAMDRGDAAALAATYHDDAIDIHWATFVGSGQDFAQYMAAEVREIPKLIHEIFNVSISLDGDRAFVESRCTSHLRIDFETAPSGCWVEQTGRCRYLDVFERRGGDWRIAHRRIVQEGGATSLVTDQPDRVPNPEAVARLWPDDLYYRGYGITELAPDPVTPRTDHWAWLRKWGAERITRR